MIRVTIVCLSIKNEESECIDKKLRNFLLLSCSNDSSFTNGLIPLSPTKSRWNQS